MSVDAAFAGAGKKEGFELWRIENLAPVKIPEITGKFYEGDSYILLATIKKNSSLVWNLHFWLGKDTSQDEAGVAAYKTVELDESLGGGPVQYREVQGSESAMFLSYFKKPINGMGGKGIEYIAGGVASGFKHVERDVYPTRLLEVKGKTVAKIVEVPLSTSSLTQGDSFILDLGLSIYIFNGPKSNRTEKLKATQFACKLDDDERGGRATVYRLDGDPRNETFWSTLGGYVDPNTLPPGLPDPEHSENFVNKIFKVSSDSSGGEVAFTEISAKGKLARGMLDTNDVFLVHSSETVYLWIGKKSSPAEKKEAMPIALKYLKQAGLPNSTPIQKVAEGVEPGAFIKEFVTWAAKRELSTKAAKSEGPAVDASSFVGKSQADDMKDDIVAAEESIKIWRIENFKTVEESPELFGQFYSGDSYIILYTFKKTKTSKEEYIIYFWLGQNSSTDEKGTAALLTKDLDDKMGGSPVQCRVVEGKEPLHFRRLFRGKMIVHQGGVPSGFRKTAGADTCSPEFSAGAVSTYIVHGVTPLSTVAKQLTASTASSLNSTDCFLVLTKDEAFVFKGKNSTPDESALADNVAGILAKGRSVVNVAEGAEPDVFWAALGGKAAYPQSGDSEELARDPRLFIASTETGSFRVEEIESFDQSDLVSDDVMLLDSYDEVFVWVGARATLEEVKHSTEFAAKYVLSASKHDGRSASTPVTKVQEGSEPSIFTRFFINWDPNYADKNKFVDPYEAKLAKMKATTSTPVSAPVVTKTAAAQTVAAPGQTFPYEALKSGVPAGVDPKLKEQYLSDADFQAVLKTSKAEFNALPGWKKDAKKKEVGLF